MIPSEHAFRITDPGVRIHSVKGNTVQSKPVRILASWDCAMWRVLPVVFAAPELNFKLEPTA